MRDYFNADLVIMYNVLLSRFKAAILLTNNLFKGLVQHKIQFMSVISHPAQTATQLQCSQTKKQK